MRQILCGAVLLAGVALVGFARGDDEGSPKGGKLKGKGGARLEMMFKKMDTNRDGKVSKEEFKKFFAQIGKAKGKAKGNGDRLDKLFEKLDEDGNGYLSKKEFRKLAELRGKLEQKKEEEQ